MLHLNDYCRKQDMLRQSSLSLVHVAFIRWVKAKLILWIDQNASEPSKEDERNTVRLWSLYCHTVSHNVPIFTYNLSPSTAIYQKVAKEIICVREFKQYLLAMNCRCRGASTLLTNLLHQRQPINQYDEGWQAQFGECNISEWLFNSNLMNANIDDGSCNEIYTGKAPPCIEDLTFGQAALVKHYNKPLK